MKLLKFAVTVIAKLALVASMIFLHGIGIMIALWWAEKVLAWVGL